jgi:hypothetical protein
MLFRAVWATIVLVRRDERMLVSFHKFRLVVRVVWLVPALGVRTSDAGNALLFWYMFSRDRNHLRFYFFSVGILYVGRGMLSILTPLGRPTGNLDS